MASCRPIVDLPAPLPPPIQYTCRSRLRRAALTSAERERAGSTIRAGSSACAGASRPWSRLVSGPYRRPTPKIAPLFRPPCLLPGRARCTAPPPWRAAVVRSIDGRIACRPSSRRSFVEAFVRRGANRRAHDGRRDAGEYRRTRLKPSPMRSVLRARRSLASGSLVHRPHDRRAPRGLRPRASQTSRRSSDADADLSPTAVAYPVAQSHPPDAPVRLQLDEANERAIGRPREKGQALARHEPGAKAARDRVLPRRVGLDGARSHAVSEPAVQRVPALVDRRG